MRSEPACKPEPWGELASPDSEAALWGLAAALVRSGGDPDEDASGSGLASGSGDDATPWWNAIRAGGDPLGEAFLRLRPAVARRAMGAVYTHPALVAGMVAQAAALLPAPVRIVDPGAGSGRFTRAAAALFPAAQVLAIESDPLAAQLLRANLAVTGLTACTQVREEDFCTIDLPPVAGATLFIGNPPYVRHHQLSVEHKRRYAATMAALGLKPASRLAGLHAHFLMHTARLARAGDALVYILAAEWLDTGYGAALRQWLLSWCAPLRLALLDPRRTAFAGTLSTAVILAGRVVAHPDEACATSLESCWCTEPAALAHMAGQPQGGGSDAPAGMMAVANGGWQRCLRPAAASATRSWMPLLRSTTVGAAADCDADGEETIALGDVFAIHRGQVTGMNRVWIAGPAAAGLPEAVLRPTVTAAREIITAAGALTSSAGLRRVVDLPVDLSVLDDAPDFDTAARRALAAFLDWARAQGADATYIARHRRAWWAVGLLEPAPVIVTYMARRPPCFILNPVGARLLNIAHGLYPRQPLPNKILRALVNHLNRHTTTDSGRIYAGGLAKFEPGALARLRVPSHLFVANT